MPLFPSIHTTPTMWLPHFDVKKVYISQIFTLEKKIVFKLDAISHSCYYLNKTTIFSLITKKIHKKNTIFGQIK